MWIILHSLQGLNTLLKWALKNLWLEKVFIIGSGYPLVVHSGYCRYWAPRTLSQCLSVVSYLLNKCHTVYYNWNTTRHKLPLFFLPSLHSNYNLTDQFTTIPYSNKGGYFSHHLLTQTTSVIQRFIHKVALCFDYFIAIYSVENYVSAGGLSVHVMSVWTFNEICASRNISGQT